MITVSFVSPLFGGGTVRARNAPGCVCVCVAGLDPKQAKNAYESVPHDPIVHSDDYGDKKT